MHDKPVVIDPKSCSASDVFSFLLKQADHVFKDIENYTNLYDQLKNTLKELDGSDYDIVQQQDIKANEEIRASISDMFKLIKK